MSSCIIIPATYEYAIIDNLAVFCHYRGYFGSTHHYKSSFTIIWKVDLFILYNLKAKVRHKRKIFVMEGKYVP